MNRFRRFVLVVLDSAGIGEMPDAAQWGDEGSDTLGHVLAREMPALPNLQKLGLANIRALPNLSAVANPSGCFGKAAILSNGKDATVGHWEMAGVPVLFEWGYFSYSDSSNPKAMRGKVLRVIKRQPDGSWKFARVVAFPEKIDSAAPMSHPCE